MKFLKYLLIPFAIVFIYMAYFLEMSESYTYTIGGDVGQVVTAHYDFDNEVENIEFVGLVTHSAKLVMGCEDIDRATALVGGKYEYQQEVEFINWNTAVIKTEVKVDGDPFHMINMMDKYLLLINTCNMKDQNDSK